jgi:hypothetical protein
MLYSQITSSLKQLFNMAWNNPGHTPGDFFSALGTDCKQTHELFLAEAAIMNAAVAGSIPSEPGTVTENSDGTCTVTMPSPSPSPSE